MCRRKRPDIRTFQEGAQGTCRPGKCKIRNIGNGQGRMCITRRTTEETMKRLATVLALAIFATAAFAAETADKQKTEEKAKAEKPAAKATASTSGAATPTEPAKSGTNAKSLNAPPPTAGAAESPLVAAARRTNRLGKTPQILITDQTLKSSGQGAHVTTTKKQEEIVISPTAGKTKTPEMIEKENRYREEKKKEIADAGAKKAEAAKENRLGQ